MDARRRSRGSGQASAPPQPSDQLIYEEFQPSFDWTHDSDGHVLLFRLPGFKREEVRVRVDNYGKVIVSGERKVSESKYNRFYQVHYAPADSDIARIRARFEQDLLSVIMPKKEDLEEQEPYDVMGNDDAKEEDDKQGQQSEPERGRLGREGNVWTWPNWREKSRERARRHDKLPERREVVKEEEEEVDFQDGLVDKLLDQVTKNKAVIVTAILAFSLGMYVSRKLR